MANAGTYSSGTPCHAEKIRNLGDSKIIRPSVESTAKPSNSKKHGYIAPIDGLRAVAVLFVVAAHADPFFSAWSLGGRGVMIFFVLSGYLITSLALNEEEKYGRISFSAFYIRRTFRIFPLYYLVLLLYCYLILVLGFVPEKRDGLIQALPYFFTYLQEIGLAVIGSEHVPFGQSWSLGYEEKFYLLWPLIIFCFLRGKQTLRPYVAGAMILIFATIGVAASPGTWWALLFPYYHILIGCLLALIKPQRWHVPLTFPAILVMLLLQFATPRFVNNHEASILINVAFSIAVAAFLAGILTEETRIRRALSWRPMVFIGKVSYGIYLIHILCIEACHKVTANPFLLLVLSIISSTAVAAVLYRVFESPLIAVGRRLSARIIDRPRMSASDFNLPGTTPVPQLESVTK
jgi:peptidoglycan/LPS O-acetylase OafA/YrhL